MSNSTFAYRPEVDGLRALAVIPVIFFHAGFDWMAGGYVGVDVFFVISGYLITSIIIREMHQGRFSLVHFYERRARRILPALFTVMAACLPFAWWWMPPDQLQEFAHSLTATSLFGANFLFWRTSDYFATAAELKPLLHTWSLANEEQYYLLFPLLVMGLWRGRLLSLTVAVTLLAVASLILSEWDGYSRGTRFYLPHTRVWELLLGSLLALLWARRGSASGPLFALPGPARELLPAAGLTLIVVAMATFDENTSFPGVPALAPTLGTALILAFGQQHTWTGRLLSTRGLVAIGLVSYSAYLWHQPLFAFARIATPSAPSSRLLGLLCVVALALAWLSWRWVEQPFRDRKKISRRQVFTLAGGGILFFSAVGLVGHWQKGFEQRMGAQVSALFEDLRITKSELCGAVRIGDQPLSLDTCRAGAEQLPVSIAVLGDSHANALYSQLGDHFTHLSRSSTLLTHSACPPVRHVTHADNNPRYPCHEFNEEVFELLAGEPAVDTLILAARWTLYLENSTFDNREGGVEPEEGNVLLVPTDTSAEWRDDGDRRALLTARIRDTVEGYLELGKTVVLVYPIPEAGWHVPSLMAYHLRRDSVPAHGYSTSYQVFQERNRATYQALDAIGEHPLLLRVYPEEVFCNTVQAGRCIVAEHGKPLYFDDDHPSLAGSSGVVRIIAAALQDRHNHWEESHGSADP